MYVENYCEPIIDTETWNASRITLEKNKHPNYGEHIHLFTALVKCPDCKKILSSTISYKNSSKPNMKKYYFLTCKNQNCKTKGRHYSCDRIELKLSRLLDELTRYMYDNSNEILTSSSTKSKDIKNIEKAIDKLKTQEKRLVDLYVNSSLDVETINQKNENIKNEISKLKSKIKEMFPDDDHKEYTVELLKKLDHQQEGNMIVFPNNFAFSFIWDSLTKKAKKEMLNRFITSFEIVRDGNYDVEITNIKFTEELISKSTNEYLEYLNLILQENQIGFTYQGQIGQEKRTELSKNNIIISMEAFAKQKYSDVELELYTDVIEDQFFKNGIAVYPYVEGNTVTDYLYVVPKKDYLLIKK